MASGPSSAGPGSSGGGFSGSFLGKQFSFASTGSRSSTDVISTQPSRPLEETPIQPQAAASVSVSNNKNTDTIDGGYKPVTNFEPQERVNPFDKEPNKTASGSGSVASITTSSSSSISSSSISSRINRNGNPIKSPPPPTGPPPPPPNVTSNANSSSGYRNSFSSSLSKDKSSYGNYGSSTSVETITRMDTNTTNTGATATGAGEASGITAITSLSSSGITGTAGLIGTGTESGIEAITTSATNDWRTAIGMRSASVYSAPAAVTTTAALPGDTSGYDSNSIASQAGYNNPSDLPSYTRPSYSRSESNASKQSDLDIIFGESKISGTNSPASHGNGKYTRAAGSLSDADMIFGGPPSNYKSDRFGAAKSMSMSASSGMGSNGSGSYKIYDGIQNAAFSDFSDTGSVSSIGSATKRWSAANKDDDDEMDLK